MAWILSFAGLTLFDLIFTMVALSMGATELNPLYHAMPHTAFWTFKVIGIVLCCMIAMMLRRPWLLAPMVAFYALVAASNLYEFAGLVNA